MKVFFGIILFIVGLFCGGALSLGETGFWLWFFALGGEIITIFIIASIILDSYIEPYGAVIKVLTVIGTAFWVISLKLLFSDVESVSLVLGLIFLAGLFIAPYFIVASLDAVFADSKVVIVLVGIAKISSSILLYLGKLTSLNNIQNDFPWKTIAFFVIVSLLTLLLFILVILDPAVCVIRRLETQWRKQKEQWQKQKIIQKESKRKQIKEKYSYQLISAVEQNNSKMVAALIEKGADINYKDFSGKVPLRIAMENNNKNMISLLMEKGADINSSDYNSRTALDYAIENEDVDLVSLLLEKGADIGDSDSSLKTALDFAIKNDNVDLLSRLAEKAAREDVQCDGKPILFFAIGKDCKKLVELLIEKGVHKKSRFDNEDFKKITPLFFATLVENKDMVSLLIKNKVDVNEKVEDSENKDCFFSPLERALGRRNKEIANILLENGADINCCNCAITPLRKAIHENDKDMATFLLEKGANINYIASYSWVDNNGTMSFTATALSEAVKSNNEEMVSFLIERGADVNLEVNDNEKYYYTMLQEAVHVKNKNIISLLIDAGADINKNSQKNAGTALINAVDIKFYDPEIVSLLIERGADVNLESALSSHTPLTLAVSKNNKDAVLLLLKHGADPNKKSSKLGTPLMVAFIAVNREMISLLMKNGANSSEIFLIAAAMPKPDAAQFLLNNGADVNCELSGQTPLISAICSSTKEMVLFLISNGADVNYETSGNVSDKTGARTPLETAIVTGKAEVVSLLITYGADVNHKCKNGNTPLLFAARHQRTELVPILKDAGAISFVPVKGAQTSVTAATSSASSDLQDDFVAFNSALVALSKIIAKNGAEIFASENSQKLKALVSDLIPQENEIAPNLKQSFSCNFAQIILEATDKSDGKKEKSFKDAVDTIVAEAGLEKEIAVLIVKLVALSLDWNFENLNLE